MHSIQRFRVHDSAPEDVRGAHRRPVATAPLRSMSRTHSGADIARLIRDTELPASNVSAVSQSTWPQDVTAAFVLRAAWRGDPGAGSVRGLRPHPGLIQAASCARLEISGADPYA